MARKIFDATNPRKPLRHCYATVRRLVVEGDTTTIRVIMAIASLLYAIGLLVPIHTFARPSFAGMQALMPDWAWAVCFILHAVGVAWRLLDEVPRIAWAFAINAFGIAIWIMYTVLVTVTLGQYTPSTAMEITVLAAAIVALVRTGLNDEKFSP